MSNFAYKNIFVSFQFFFLSTLIAIISIRSNMVIWQKCSLSLSSQITSFVYMYITSFIYIFLFIRLSLPCVGKTSLITIFFTCIYVCVCITVCVCLAVYIHFSTYLYVIYMYIKLITYSLYTLVALSKRPFGFCLVFI